MSSAVADLNVGRAREPARDRRLAGRAVSPRPRSATRSSAARTHVTDDAEALIACPGIEVIVEATGDPEGRHPPRAEGDRARQAHRDGQRRGRRAGGAAARRARRKAAGVVYSLAWGDQPALICEHVDWARACGFKVVAAGKGTRYEPHYHQSTPDTVWDILDKYLKITDRKSINPKMFNSLHRRHQVRHRDDGGVQRHRPRAAERRAWAFRRRRASSSPRSASRRARAARWRRRASPRSRRRSIATARDVPHHLALGTYVVFEGETEYARRCFRNTPCCRTRAARYAALYRPIHMIGLELGISVASAALRKEPTGAPTGFRSDVVATAKRDLKKGEMLDGEGGYLRLGQADAGRPLARRGAAAARPRAQRQAQARHRGGRGAEMGRRRVRPERYRREGAARDGSGVRAAECVSGVPDDGR